MNHLKTDLRVFLPELLEQLNLPPETQRTLTVLLNLSERAWHVDGSLSGMAEALGGIHCLRKLKRWGLVNYRWRREGEVVVMFNPRLFEVGNPGLAESEWENGVVLKRKMKGRSFEQERLRQAGFLPGDEDWEEGARLLRKWEAEEEQELARELL